ncbi:MAG: hypothetical protein RLY86_1090 [Pseudomonadota bacterium]|jgi:L-ascorbate metabolism protein UlaG (beta-lactamase superfamily)
MAAFIWRRIRGSGRPVSVPAGHALPTGEALVGWRALGDRPGLCWLGHVAFLIRIGRITVLTDPWLSDHASPLPGRGPKRFVPPGIAVADLPDVDVLLLSHAHYDHLCAPTLRALAARMQPLVLVPLGLGPMLRRLGFTRVEEMDWEQTRTVTGNDGQGVVFGCLPSIHGSARSGFDKNRSLWCSWSLAGGGRRLWFGGDTAHGPVFAEMGRRHGPFDLALVGIGAYEPRVLMKPVHANPEDAVAIARDLRAARILGMHWGTVVLTEEDPFEPPTRFHPAAAAAGFAPEDAWLLRIGETRSLP